MINLHETGLRMSPRLARDKTNHQDSDLMYKFFTNHSIESKSPAKRKISIAERIIHTKEWTSKLCDNTINHGRNFIMIVVDNEKHAFK